MPVGTLRIVLALLLGCSIAPRVALASDDDAKIEKAAETTSELIAYTRVLFDCNLLIETIEPFPIQNPQDGVFFVTLEADGKECEQAFDLMNRRGRNQGLFFRLPRDSETEGERPAGTLFNLGHEIDPETEE